jgi:hypothetical protein
MGGGGPDPLDGFKSPLARALSLALICSHGAV